MRIALLFISALLLVGCKSAVPASDAGNWICEHRGGVDSYGGKGNYVVVCKDGHSRSTDLWREFDADEQRQVGPYYENSADEPATRKEAP